MTTIKVSLKTWKEKWKQKKASKTFHSRNNTHFKPGSYMYFYSYVISSIDKALNSWKNYTWKLSTKVLQIKVCRCSLKQNKSKK